jgi:hypothetical protein
MSAMMQMLMAGSISIPVTSYANTGGTGNRTAIITCSTNITVAGGVIGNLVDGSNLNGVTNSVDFNGAANTNGNFIAFAWAAVKYIDEVNIYCAASAPSNGVWVWEYSVNGSTAWTQVASFTWNTQTQTVALTGVPGSGALAYRMRKNGTLGSMSNIYYGEVEFKISP